MKTLVALGAAFMVLLAIPTTTAFAGTKYFGATLAGASEVPTVATGAAGAVCLTLDTTTMQLTGTVVYAGTGTAGGVYGIGIFEGAVGSPSASGVMFANLPRGPSPVAVDTTLDSAHTAKMSDVVTNPLYVNLFSAVGPVPGGELRGALVEKGTPDPCGPLDAGAGAAVDAGADAGGDGGSSTGPGGTGDGGAGGAGGGGGVTPTDDSGTTSSDSPKSSSGCSSAAGPTNSGMGFAFAFGVAVIAALSRARRRR